MRRLAESLTSPMASRCRADGAPPGHVEMVDRTVVMAGLVPAINVCRLEQAGKHSVRINDQWRIVFRWTKAGPEDVEITDD